jgi:hypothetical protein
MDLRSRTSKPTHEVINETNHYETFKAGNINGKVYSGFQSHETNKSITIHSSVYIAAKSAIREESLCILWYRAIKTSYDKSSSRL